VAHDVFISYSSPDKPIADAICATLEAKKIRCWIAPRDVLAGMPYGEALSEAIQTSQALVIVLSSNSNQSAHVMREVEGAVGKGIPVLPFRIEDVQPSRSLDYFLKSIHWLDALTPPLEKHLQTLAETVRLVLARELAHGSAGAEESAHSHTVGGDPPARAAAAGGRQRPRGVRSWAVMIAIGIAVALGMIYLAWPAATGSAPPSTAARVKPLPAPGAGSRAHPGQGAGPEEKTKNDERKEEPSADVAPAVAVRKVIERYYELLSKKDEEGVLALYSRGVAPASLDSIRQVLHDLVIDTGGIELKHLAIDRVEVSGGIAKAHVTVELVANTVVTGEPYFQAKPSVLNWDLVEEADGWRLVQDTSEDH
jgi:hypothetical protein